MRLSEWVAQKDSQVIQRMHDSLHLPWDEVIEGNFLNAAVLLLGTRWLGAITRGAIRC